MVQAGFILTKSKLIKSEWPMPNLSLSQKTI